MFSIVGRWEKLRELGPGGWGTPWMLDRKKGLLLPYRCAEWWRAPTGEWVRLIGGGSGTGGVSVCGPLSFPTRSQVDSLTQTTIALNNNYTVGTAGNAIGVRHTPRANVTLTALYFYITSFTGTAANVTDINWEVRNSSGGVPATGSPVGSGTKNPASTTGWIGITGLSIALTGGTSYWFVIGDANGNSNDFATVLRNTTHAFSNNLPDSISPWASASTTNGWVGTPNSAIMAGCIVAVFDDGTSRGNCFAEAGTVTSNALQKGLYIGGLTAPLKVAGINFKDSAAVAIFFSGANIWDGTNGPSGTAFAAASKGIQARPGSSSVSGYWFDSAVTLAANTAYRCVFTYSGSNAVPFKYQIGTGNNASIRAAMLGAGGWYWTEEVAGPAWSDDTNALPNMSLLVEDQVAGGGGGGGAPVIGSAIVRGLGRVA